MTLLFNKKIERTVKYYVNKELHKIHWIWGFIKALFETFLNFFSWQIWYGVFIFFVIYCVASTIYIAMKYVAGGVCFLIKKIIDVINTAREILLMHGKIDVKEIDALSALVDGTCDEFSSWRYTIRYWISRSLGNTLCEDMLWYESITLTRWFVARPLSFMYTSVGVTPGEMCQLDMVWDMCAGVIGTNSLLVFMVKKGLWIILGLVLGYPLIRYVLRVMNNALHIFWGEVHFWLYKFQPHLKEAKHTFVNFLQRVHLFSTHGVSTQNPGLSSNDEQFP